MLKVRNISKTYRIKGSGEKNSIKAVDDVSFDIQAGEIVGLIGPNGAGKSTIIKLISGLAKADSGSIKIGGYDLGIDHCKALDNLGVIIEVPELDKTMTARDNLKYLARLQGGVSEEDVNRAIKFTLLEDRIDDKFEHYSLGMKQRLGLAQAIMHSPKVLVLDEPTNGMDPQWIISTRKLLLKLAKEMNVGILISSHILGELQLLCDKFLVLVNGRVVLETDKEHLKNLGLDKGQISITCVVDDIDKAKDLIKDKFGVDAQTDKNTLVVVLPVGLEPAILNKELIMNGINVRLFTVHQKSLEDIFNMAVVEASK